jgi:hypothetical protein
VSSSDEFNDPFSEDAGGGLLEMEGGRNIQGAKVAKERREDGIADCGKWIEEAASSICDPRSPIPLHFRPL